MVYNQWFIHHFKGQSVYLSFKKINILVLLSEILIMSIIITLAYKIYTLSNTMETDLNNKQKMMCISDELRQSSDDLTHFARTYTVTADEKFKQQYFTTLAIRDGELPRPKMYQTIYWDLKKEIREKRHPSEKKSALKQRIEKLPFTQEEKKLLLLSELNSNDLVSLEKKAFKLMQNNENFKENQALAIIMLHSQDYYDAKHKIMNPIDEFLMLLGKRIAEENSSMNNLFFIYHLLFYLSIIVLIVVNIYFYFYLKTQDRKERISQKKLETKFQDLVESSVHLVWEVNVNGEYTYCSNQVEKMLGFRVSEVLGKTPFTFMKEEEREKIRQKFLNIIKEGKDIVELENINIHKDGNEVYLLTSGSPFYDENNALLGYRGMDVDITQQKFLEQRLHNYSKDLEKEVQARTKALEFQAHYDTLTQLPNRVLFQDRLNQAIKKAKRDNSLFALLFIDLDHFKEINDSLGHQVGDEVLKEVTVRLNQVLRKRDTLSRLGGDEFTIIIEDLKHGEDASILAQNILEVLSQALNVNDHELYISSSIGISLYPDDGRTGDNLLKFADAAMYKAKAEGRNNFQYYNAKMTEVAFERVIMETSIRVALKDNDFLVYYQAQVNAKENRLIGMEALVRWNHPTMGLISPIKFIPLAESNGLIVSLDRFVMRTAMTQLVQWYKQGLNPGVLAMNLSIKQLKQQDFLEFFMQLIDETNCRAEWIELEVTEGQIMKNPEEAIKVLKSIHELGVELAIDDFGTGYSSLAYLKRLPIDKLKIDQAFVQDLPDDEEDAGITKAVIALAKSLNLKILAEGVETEEQKDFIVEHGCENIQGYFYSKPIPADDLEKILIHGLGKS